MICDNCGMEVDKMKVSRDTKIIREPVDKDGNPCKLGPFFAPLDFDHEELAYKFGAKYYQCGYCGTELDPIEAQK